MTLDSQDLWLYESVMNSEERGCVISYFPIPRIPLGADLCGPEIHNPGFKMTMELLFQTQMLVQMTPGKLGFLETS